MNSLPSFPAIATVCILLMISLCFSASAQGAVSAEEEATCSCEASDTTECDPPPTDNPKTADGSVMFIASIPILGLVMLGSCKKLRL